MSDDRLDQDDVRAELPASVGAFLRALNAGDERALRETFAERSLVNDEGQEYSDRPGVDTWAAHVILDQRLRIEPRAVTINGDQVRLTATADGAFDKRGLPDPLLLALYFSLRRDEIVQLIILRTEPDAAAY
jgi:hypothetical protein